MLVLQSWSNQNMVNNYLSDLTVFFRLDWYNTAFSIFPFLVRFHFWCYSKVALLKCFSENSSILLYSLYSSALLFQYYLGILSQFIDIFPQCRYVDIPLCSYSVSTLCLLWSSTLLLFCSYDNTVAKVVFNL